MVTLKTRWEKEKRRWDAKRYRSMALRAGVAAAIGGAILGALIAVVRIVPAFFRSAIAPGLSSRAVPGDAVGASPSSGDASAFDVGLVHQLEKTFTVSGYTLILPKDFNADVLPQPFDVPRGGHFTGLRFRGPAGDAAQLVINIIDDPNKANTDARTTEARLSEMLDGLFERMTRNSAAVGFARGKDQFGEMNGLPYVRTGFSGNFRDARKRPRNYRHGIALATFELSREVCLYFFCEEATDRHTYRLMEASLSTLRRVDAHHAGADGAPKSDP